MSELNNCCGTTCDKQAAIAERDALVAQNYECKFFIESVMANIGAGATLSEVTDMLCDWWDSNVAVNKTPEQCLREIQTLSDRVNRSVDIEQHLFDVANGKRLPLTKQDCRILALRLGTPRKMWTEQMKHHVFGEQQC